MIKSKETEKMDILKSSKLIKPNLKKGKKGNSK